MNKPKFKVGQIVLVKGFEEIKKIDVDFCSYWPNEAKNVWWSNNCEKVFTIVQVNSGNKIISYNFREINTKGWPEMWLNDILTEKLKLLG